MNYNNFLNFTVSVIFLFTTSVLNGQHEVLIDDIPDKICKEAKRQQFQNNDAVIKFFIRSIKSYQLDSTGNEKVFVRLQRICDLFSEALHNNQPNQGDWVLHETKPLSKLKKGEAESFFNHSSYSYKEPTGDNVHVELTSGSWDESFHDGTISKLGLERLSENTFKLIFKESNNAIRKNLSKKGEEYFYELIEMIDDDFLVSVEIPNNNIYYTFRMYKKYKM